MVDVSFLIASHKPYPLYGFKVVNSIKNIKDNHYTYEILFCSPHQVDDNRFKFIKDNKEQGSIPVFNELIKNHAKGDYVAIMTDDHLVDNNFFDSIDFLQSDVYKNRKYNICTLGSASPCYLPPTFGPSWKDNWIKLPPYLVMRFPVASMETIKNHLGGYIFHPCFKNHFADNYLGYFLGTNGEEGLECKTTGLHVMPESIGWQNSNNTYWEPFFNDNAPFFYKESYFECVKLLKNYKKDMNYDILFGEL